MLFCFISGCSLFVANRSQKNVKKKSEEAWRREKFIFSSKNVTEADIARRS